MLVLPSNPPECKSHPTWTKFKEWRGRRVCTCPILHLFNALCKLGALHFVLTQVVLGNEVEQVRTDNGKAMNMSR